MDHLTLLYHARINIPKACEIAGMVSCEESWEAMKVQFREWCEGVPHNLEVYNSFNNHAELVQR